MSSLRPFFKPGRSSSLAIVAAASLAATAFLIPTPGTARAAEGTLPLSVVFKGQERFDRLVAQAAQENWRALPIGDRTARVGLALVGIPYTSFTLEIDDRIEAPSVNLRGLDCWTFYEISLAFARMLRLKEPPYAPADLLRVIESERYRNGVCTGGYLSRFHFLEDLFQDNEKRGLLTDITRRLGGAERIPTRQVREMTVMWRYYRYLRNNPELRGPMAEIEARDSRLDVFHVPKERVPGVEDDLQNGDVIAITSRDTGGYTSHVGLACRDKQGNLRFLHASSKRRGVILDDRLSRYLNEHRDHAGIIVARPRDLR